MRRKSTDQTQPTCEITTFQAANSLDFDGVVKALTRRRRPISIFIGYKQGRTESERRANAIRVDEGGLVLKSSTGAATIGRLEKRGNKLWFLPS